MKHKAIYKYRNKYPISKMCGLFKISRRGYYDFLKRIEKSDKDGHLVELIRKCHERTESTYRYSRVKLWILRETGENINHKAVLRVMNKYGLLSKIRRKSKYKYATQYVKCYDDILNRDFSAKHPNEKWVTDISYIKPKQGVLYLSVIKDLFDNSIVAHKMGTVQNTRLVLETIKSVKQKEKVTKELQFHSDQGFQVRQEVA